jgi:hypothetical protein
MSDHLSDDQLRALHAGDSRLGEAERHLAECATCRARAWILLDIGVRVESVRRELLAEDLPAHLSYETLERLVGGSAGDAEIELARQHLNDCGICQRELDDLRDFAAELAVASPPSGGAAAQSAIAGPATLVPPGVEPAGIAGRSRGGAGRWLGIAAGVAATLAGSWWVLQVGPRKPRPSVPEAPPATRPAEPAPADESVVLLRDRSGVIRRRADGSLAGLPAGRFASRVAAVLAGGPLPRSSLATALAAEPGQLRGASDADPEVVLQTPVSEVVEDDTPEFGWRGSREQVVHVEVFDETLREVAAGVAQSGSWSPPAPLARGRTYLWQLRVGEGVLTAVHPRPPLPPARFHVLSSAAADEVREALASGSHLAAAVVYSRHGMTAAAIAELRALRELDPDSAVPRRLLAQLDGDT